jgi:hypothetical protein
MEQKGSQKLLDQILSAMGLMLSPQSNSPIGAERNRTCRFPHTHGGGPIVRIALQSQRRSSSHVCRWTYSRPGFR